MTLAGLPLSASVVSITSYPDDSITDQINSSQPQSKSASERGLVLSLALIVTIGCVGLLAFVTRRHAIWQSIRQKSTGQVSLQQANDLN